MIGIQRHRARGDEHIKDLLEGSSKRFKSGGREPPAASPLPPPIAPTSPLDIERYITEALGLEIRTKEIDLTARLVFRVNPNSVLVDSSPISSVDNRGEYALSTFRADYLVNAEHLDLENAAKILLDKCHKALGDVDNHSSDGVYGALRWSSEKAVDALDTVREAKFAQWNAQCRAAMEADRRSTTGIYNNGSHNGRPARWPQANSEPYPDANTQARRIKGWHTTLVLCLASAAVMHYVAYVSNQASQFLLASYKSIMDSTILLAGGPEVADSYKEWTSRIPKHVQTAIAQFELDPVTTDWTCCPACYNLTRFSVTGPDQCQYKKTPASRPCGEDLYRKAGKSKRARKVLRHQSLAAWIGRLLSRPGISSMMRCTTDPASGAKPNVSSDVWDSDFVREFPGPDGQRFIFKTKDGLNLLFSLNVDGFNPYTNKQAGVSYTATGIYMCCLNLPMSM